MTIRPIPHFMAVEMGRAAFDAMLEQMQQTVAQETGRKQMWTLHTADDCWRLHDMHEWLDEAGKQMRR